MAVYTNVSTMVGDDAVAYAQAEAASLAYFACGEKRIKYLGEVLGSDPNSVVRNRNLHLVNRGGCDDRDCPFPVRRLEKRLPGAWGVMMDDVAAGVLALVVLEFALWGLAGLDSGIPL